MARTATLEGKTHFVVPMVMLTEGVHNGSNGPILYQADDLRASLQAWNGRPVVVYHPQLNGRGVSACDPDIVNRYKIGTVFNARFDGKRLTAEAWIDQERVGQVDDRVLQTILHNRQMEISTGLYFGFDVGEGTWNGQPYIATARNHQPDHLAILPDLKGACSISDGCGLMRNKENVMEPLGLPSTV